MLAELTVIPLGADIHISDELAAVVEVVDRSGLPYQLGPTSTAIEGEWDEVMAVIRQAHDRARQRSAHVITTIKIEDDEGSRGKLTRNVASVQEKADRPLSTSSS